MANEARVNRIEGTGIPLSGDDIDTDRIIPARYLRCVTFDGLGEYAFKDDRLQDPNHPFNNESYRMASILIVGKNFGCGSSREHAPQSLNRWGIKGIIGESFAEIFFANCHAIGIPCFCVSTSVIEELRRYIKEKPSSQLVLDLESLSIKIAEQQSFPAQFPEGVRQSFLTGTWDATTVLLEAGDQIEKLAKTLPYLSAPFVKPTTSG